MLNQRWFLKNVADETDSWLERGSGFAGFCLAKGPTLMRPGAAALSNSGLIDLSTDTYCLT